MRIPSGAVFGAVSTAVAVGFADMIKLVEEYKKLWSCKAIYFKKSRSASLSGLISGEKEC